MSDPDKERLDAALREAVSIIRRKDDSAIPQMLGDGTLDQLLEAIAPRKTSGEQTIYDYLLANKNRLQLVALVRHAIHHNYSMKGTVNGRPCFVSPDFHQWFKDGVMFLQGGERFAGTIGLYQDAQVKFAVAARDVAPGDQMGPDDLLFLSVSEYEKIDSERAVPKQPADLDSVLVELHSLLERREASEATYQSFFNRNPWVLGLQYIRVDSHTALDDANIPDFTGVRATNGTRDIIEIKQPFVPLFCRDGSFRSEFLRAWQQAEDYLEFSIAEARYLNERKGLRFENPHCLLLLGYNLSKDQIGAIRRKERMNPRIRILTYNDVLALGKNTAELAKALGGGDEVASYTWRQK